MRATARLRRLLDKYGITWTNQVYTGEREDDTTCWAAPIEGHPYDMAGATEVKGRLWYQGYATPDQIIRLMTDGDTCCMQLLPDEPATSIQPERCTKCGHKTYAQLPSYCPHCGRRVV